MAARTVLVTGATGNVGSPVVRALRARGIAVIAAARDEQRVRDHFDPDVRATALDFTKPHGFDAALEGATSVFLVRPPAIASVGRTVNRFVSRAAARGVEHVVFLSVVGADRHRLIPHHAIERSVVESGLGYTFLRAGFFAQNLAGPYRNDIRADDRLFLPAGDGRVAFVDVRDIAEVAAQAFADDRCRRAAWDLTGAEALSFDDVARLLSEALGRPIRYERAGLYEFARHLRTTGLPLAYVAVQAVLHHRLKSGSGERVDPALGDLLGRPPRSLADYIADHRDLWSKV